MKDVKKITSFSLFVYGKRERKCIYSEKIPRFFSKNQEISAEVTCS